MPLTCYTVTIQCLMDRVEQVLIPEGLGQELYGAGFHGPHRHRDIAMGGNEDYWDLNARIGQLVLKVQTVDSGKSYVQNQTTWLVRSLVVQKLLRRPEALRAQSHRLQQSLNGRSHIGIVIDDKHSWVIRRLH